MIVLLFVTIIDIVSQHRMSTSVNVSPSNSPRGVIFRCGTTVNAIKERDMNAFSSAPVFSRAVCRVSISAQTSSYGLSVMSPPIGRESTVTSSPQTTAMPPFASATALTAVKISASVAPAAMMLWASCETEVASAPRSMLRPLISPRPNPSAR